MHAAQQQPVSDLLRMMQLWGLLLGPLLCVSWVTCHAGTVYELNSGSPACVALRSSSSSSSWVRVGAEGTQPTGMCGQAQRSPAL